MPQHVDDQVLVVVADPTGSVLHARIRSDCDSAVTRRLSLARRREACKPVLYWPTIVSLLEVDGGRSAA